MGAPIPFGLFGVVFLCIAIGGILVGIHNLLRSQKIESAARRSSISSMCSFETLRTIDFDGLAILSALWRQAGHTTAMQKGVTIHVHRRHLSERVNRLEVNSVWNFDIFVLWEFDTTVYLHIFHGLICVRNEKCSRADWEASWLFR